MNVFLVKLKTSIRCGSKETPVKAFGQSPDLPIPKGSLKNTIESLTAVQGGGNGLVFIVLREAIK